MTYCSKHDEHFFESGCRWCNLEGSSSPESDCSSRKAQKGQEGRQADREASEAFKPVCNDIVDRFEDRLNDWLNEHNVRSAISDLQDVMQEILFELTEKSEVHAGLNVRVQTAAGERPALPNDVDRRAISSHCYDSMVAEQNRLCRLMGWATEQVGLMLCKDSYGIVLGMWPASELCEKLEELSKAVCDYQLANIGQEFLDGMAEPVTVECPFCQTPITKESEACCMSMIAVKAISQKYGKPRFTVHEHSGEWVLRVHHPNGSYAGVGVLNGEIEANAVCKTLNESVASDSFEESRWMEYFA